MTAPAYHLRPNKAADRYLLMDAIGRIARLGGGLNSYTYYGLGGPYLEDFRLLYETHPTIRMVSIEKDAETFERQKFHRPCSTLKLVNQSMSEFIADGRLGEDKSILWLDYTKLTRGCFTDFQSALDTVVDDSMIKVTMRANPKGLWTEDMQKLSKQGEEFMEVFDDFLPNSSATPPTRLESFANLLQDMIGIAAQQVLNGDAGGGEFVPVSSFRYSDGTPMFTLTGVVCGADGEDRLNAAFGDWDHANLSWKPPELINVPTLSTKERLHLQPLLPDATSGKELRESLGYSIKNRYGRADDALMQYAKFHRHTPYFLKGTP